MDLIREITRTHAEELRLLVRESSERVRTSSFVIEGPHLIERAFETAPERIKEVIFTEEALAAYPTLVKRAERKAITCYHVSAKFSERISDTKSPQGIFALVSMPQTVETRHVASLPNEGILIALDGVQDAGNVGTIIRTAAWFGIKRIFLSSECADPYSAKVLRATQGEIFSITVGNRGDLRQNVVSLQKKGFQIVAATLETSACLLYKMEFAANTVLVFGSEAHGISKEILTIADVQIIVPKFGQGESLNVATSVGVILSEAMRKRRE